MLSPTDLFHANWVPRPFAAPLTRVRVLFRSPRPAVSSVLLENSTGSLSALCTRHALMRTFWMLDSPSPDLRRPKLIGLTPIDPSPGYPLVTA